MTSTVGITLLRIPVEVCFEYVFVISLPIPATLVGDIHAGQPDKARQQLQESAFEVLNGTLPVLVQAMAQSGQLTVPHSQLRAIYSITSQQAIAVFQAALHAFPGGKELRFHVKH